MMDLSGSRWIDSYDFLIGMNVRLDCLGNHPCGSCNGEFHGWPKDWSPNLFHRGFGLANWCGVAPLLFMPVCVWKWPYVRWLWWFHFWDPYCCVTFVVTLCKEEVLLDSYHFCSIFWWVVVLCMGSYVNPFGRRWYAKLWKVGNRLLKMGCIGCGGFMIMCSFYE